MSEASLQQVYIRLQLVKSLVAWSLEILNNPASLRKEYPDLSDGEIDTLFAAAQKDWQEMRSAIEKTFSQEFTLILPDQTKIKAFGPSPRWLIDALEEVEPLTYTVIGEEAVSRILEIQPILHTLGIIPSPWPPRRPWPPRLAQSDWSDIDLPSFLAGLDLPEDSG